VLAPTNLLEERESAGCVQRRLRHPLPGLGSDGRSHAKEALSLDEQLGLSGLLAKDIAELLVIVAVGMAEASAVRAERACG